ncbi:filamentous hemagglutinin family protein [Paraburkholderia unamae]|uniref:two-partner secretion domain-containing protein n=1 Tax=Paraburkholderia unamae TaxID=219649 RepID=UPI000DC23103|nr:filamentous hemagglutinin N-terminal domain-containing protein [Paraburkholderia unamae]RAR57606.1 filamentous hemagglutinin family protein [Paraburkholderia unamae]
MNKRGRTQPACTVRPLQVKAIASVAAALFEAAYAPLLFANPTGAQVVAGGVTVSTPSSSQMNITQSTPNAIVNWNTFSIATGESVNIAQPSAQAALLNRVMGNDPSTIAGSLRANGKVLLVNPAGVIFSPGSSVNVGSLVASTLGISNADFLAGNFHFVGKAPAAVTNAGTITAADGGTIALLGGTVTNSGTVAARLGTVAMGAGGDITLDFAGDGLTTIKINAGTANALLGNTGTLAADGGTVVMSAQTAQALADTVINQQGIVRAQSLAERDGHIILDGGSNGVTLVSGTLDASGGAGLKGGQVDVTGYDVALLAGANVNASGAAGGGAVRFGGGAAGADPSIRNANAVWMDPTAQIHADALTNGNGGHIVAYGTTAARLYGTLSAQGGPQGADGGLIETSGQALDVSGSTINASAPKGNAGTWLLDPFSVYIEQGGDQSESVGTPGGSVEYGPLTAGTTITNGTINAALNLGTSVKIATGTDADGDVGDINVQSAISKTSGGNATFTLEASGSVTIGYAASISSTSGALGLVIDANVGGASPGSVVTLQNTSITTNGGSVQIGTNGQSPIGIGSSTINTQGGDLTLTGNSPANANAVTAISINSSLLSTAGGNATLTGTVPDTSSGDGISLVTSSITTSRGKLSLTGTGGSTGGVGSAGVYLSSYYTDPVTQAVAATLDSGGGAITVTGTLGSTAAGATNGGSGIWLQFANLVGTTGNVTLTGTVYSNAASTGVVLGLGSSVSATSGNVNVTGAVNTVASSGSTGSDAQTHALASGSYPVVTPVTDSPSTTGGTGSTGSSPTQSETGPGSPPTQSETGPGSPPTNGETGGNDGAVAGNAPLGQGVQIYDASISTVGGTVTVSGSMPSTYSGGIGTVIDGSTISTSSGAIALSGQSIGTPSASAAVQGIVLRNPSGSATSVQSNSGPISINGSGSGSGTEGVLITDATKIQTTTSGAIDIRGAVRGAPQQSGSTSNAQNDAGVVINNATVSAPGSISIAGSTDTSDYGVVLGYAVSGFSTEGSVAISTGTGGSLILRAANDNTAKSLVASGLTVQVPAGTLVIAPASVDPTSFAIVAQNATLITLFGTGTGMTIDAATFAALTQDVGTVILGSKTQTGLITVDGVCAANSDTCVLTRPTFTTNLTLENDASGSQGIQLPYGLSVGTSGTLGLASAGTVTQGGPVTAGTLALVGAGTFTLTNANNSVATLSVNSTGNVTLTDATGVELSPAQVAIFDPGSGTFGAVAYKGDVSLTPAGNLTVTANGDIGLGYDVHDSGSNSTFSLQAAGNIYVETDGTVTFTSTGGPVNVVFDANVGPNATPGNYVVRLDGLTLDTNGGTFTIGDTGKSAVDIEDSYITTEAGAIGITGTNAAGVGVAIGYSFIGTGMGNVTVNGTSTGGIRTDDSAGVYLYDSGIQTGGGSISVTGNAEFAAGTDNGGVVVAGDYSGTAGGSAADAFSVTGSGTIGLTGTASNGNSSTATNGNAYGVLVGDATLAAQSGNITLNGTATAPGMTTGGYAIGVDVIDATIRTTSTGAIGLTGTATSTGYGYGIAISGSALNTGGGDATMNGTLNVSAIGSGTVPAQNAYGFAIGTSSISTGGGNVSITGTASSAVSDPHVATGALLTGTTVDTTSGNVTVVGTGQSASGAVDYKNGTWIYDSKLTTTTGNVSITGNSNALGNGVLFSYSGVSSTGGSITFYGTSGIAGQGAPFSFSYGVYMVGAYPTGSVFAPGSASNPTLSTTGNGTIEITGTAAGNYARGVELDNGALTTANGAMTLNGTANVAKSGTGVRLSNMLLTANAGTVQATGTVNDAPGGTADGYGVWTVGSSILTDQGGVTLNGTTAGATSYAYGVYLDGGFAAGTTVQPTIQTGSGAISVTGNVPATQTGSVAVDLVGATVTSSGGAITLKGNTTGTPASGLSSDGVVLTSLVPGTVTTPTSVTTGSGTLTIDGSGFGTNAQGVLVAGGSTITSSNAGTIDIRGVATGPTNGGTQYDYGTLIYNGTISATAPNTTISIAGSTNTADAGLAFGAAPVPSTFTYASGPVKVNAGTNGTLALRAANDGTTSSFVNDGATITANDGTLALMPASVNPGTFNFTALDGTPITLFGTGAPGLSIDATAFSLFSGFSTFVLGSSTQTGLITVSGVCASSSSCTSLTKPSMNENLTLMNLGAGSQGIQLLYGISLGANTLTLASAGAVTDPGGIQAAGLLLDGPGNFTLNDPENNVGVLAMLNVGNVNFLNSTSFVIGPIVSHSFDAASNTAATIDATNSNLTGNLLAQAATGGIGLGGGAASAGGPTGGANTNLSAGGTIDLVMENGVFTDNGTGSVSANNGWRIWVSTWVGETRGNVQPNTLQPNFYGCSFGAGCVWGGTVPLTGDHFVYVARPTVTVTANGVTRVWGAPNPNFTYTTSGLINGDTAAGALSGTLSTSANSGSLPGQYAIDPSFLSGVGYIVIEQPGTLNVVVPQPTYAPDLPLAVSGLQSFFGPSEKTFVYENNLQGTNICVGSNQPLFTTAPPGENQDLLAVEWKRVRSQPNLNSCMLLNGQHGCGDF